MQSAYQLIMQVSATFYSTNCGITHAIAINVRYPAYPGLDLMNSLRGVQFPGFHLVQRHFGRSEDNLGQFADCPLGLNRSSTAVITNG
jgi:hypothetical protein